MNYKSATWLPSQNDLTCIKEVFLCSFFFLAQAFLRTYNTEKHTTIKQCYVLK